MPQYIHWHTCSSLYLWCNILFLWDFGCLVWCVCRSVQARCIVYKRIFMWVLYKSVFVCLGIVQNVFVFGCVVWRWVQCKQGNHKEGACVGGGQSATHTCIVQYCSPKWWPVCYAFKILFSRILFTKMVECQSALCVEKTIHQKEFCPFCTIMLQPIIQSPDMGGCKLSSL